jgi:hypothetical protein
LVRKISTPSRTPLNDGHHQNTPSGAKMSDDPMTHPSQNKHFPDPDNVRCSISSALGHCLVHLQTKKTHQQNVLYDREKRNNDAIIEIQKPVVSNNA